MHAQEEREFVNIITKAYNYFNESKDVEGTRNLLSECLSLFEIIRENIRG